jgi:hypothetical protein
MEAGQHEADATEEDERADAEPRGGRGGDEQADGRAPPAAAVKESWQCRGRRGAVLPSSLSFC